MGFSVVSFIENPTKTYTSNVTAFSLKAGSLTRPKQSDRISFRGTVKIV